MQEDCTQNKLKNCKKKVTLPFFNQQKQLLPFNSTRSLKINDLIGKMLTTQLLPFLNVKNSGTFYL